MFLFIFSDRKGMKMILPKPGQAGFFFKKS